MSQDSPELKYFQQLSFEEKQKAEQYLDGMTTSLDADTKEAITDLFSDISTRIRVVEEYLVKMHDNNTSEGFVSQKSRVSSLPMPQVEMAKLAVMDLEHRESLGELQYNQQGAPFRYFFSEGRLEESFHINRHMKTTLAVEFEGSCSEDSLRAIEVQIDGVKLKSKIVTLSHQKRVLVHIPKRKDGGHTHLRLIAPKLQSDEKLAMFDIYCVPRQSLTGFVKQRLTS